MKPDPTPNDSPLRIGLLTWQYPPASSGLPRAAREVARALGEAGHDVRVLTLDRDDRERDGPVEVIGRLIDPSSPLGRLRRRMAIGHLAAPWAFRRLVRSEHAARPFDVVEATNWFAPGFLLSGRGSVPFVTRNSTPATIGKHARAGWRDRIDGWFLDAMERRSARRSAALISNTQAHRERIRRFYGLKDEAIHEAIAPPVDPLVLERGAAASYPPDDVPFRFVFIGRPDHRKGFDAIAEALLLLAKDESGPPFTLRLVGTDEHDLPPSLQSGSARRLIEPLGRLDDEALAREMEDAHVVLAPSRSESFGYVYQEALAYGRPLIASAEDASARAFVGEPGAGLLAKATSGTPIADAMRRLIREPALRHDLRERALAAAGRCTREECARRTADVYRRVLREVSA